VRRFQDMLDKPELDEVIAAGNKERMLGYTACAMSESVYTQDFETSNEILKRCAHGGLPQAHRELARRYYEGMFLPLNVKEGFAHIHAEAELGSGPAMRMLGDIYSTGRSDYCAYGPTGPVDEAQSLLWYRRAADASDTYASEKVADILRADRMARDCSREELREIESRYKAAASYFKWGTMYCTDKKSASADEIREALRLYHTGRLHAHKAIAAQCADILISWGEAIPEPKRKDECITATEVVLTPIAIWLWSIVGTALLGLFIAINAITIPIAIGGGIIYLVWQFIKKSK